MCPELRESGSSSVPSVRDLDLAPGDRVLVRVDYNVTFHEDGRGISDDTRISESLPTIEYLLERRCRVILCSHIGRPRGRRDDRYGLAPVAARLSDILSPSRAVSLAPDCVGPDVESMVARMAPGDVLMLENLRFHAGEEKNDADFAASLAKLADFYVNDGFGVAHRRHASTSGVAEFLPAASGLLMERELNTLSRVIDRPESPYAVVVGGAKVSDKIHVIERMAGIADMFLIGGGMATAFLSAAGAPIDDSILDATEVSLARRILEDSKSGAFELALPLDVIAAAEFERDSDAVTVMTDSIPPGYMVMDIGPRTVEAYAEKLSQALTVVWNGPMGVFEWPEFSNGTRGIARAIADLDRAYTVIGGGSTADAVNSMNLRERFSHVSTGGGATLDYLEGKTLPAIAALSKGSEPATPTGAGREPTGIRS